MELGEEEKEEGMRGKEKRGIEKEIGGKNEGKKRDQRCVREVIGGKKWRREEKDKGEM